MKYCSKCGNELPDVATTCPNCGTSISQQTSDPIPPATKSSSRLGIAALILSICGFMTGFLEIGIILDVIAIVCAILVLKKSRQKQIKTGMAIAGCVIATVSIILCFLFFGPSWFSKLRDHDKLTEPKVTIAVELPNEIQTFENADELIDTYYENEVRNENIYTNRYNETILTTVDTIKNINMHTKRISILGTSGTVEFADITLENGCQFSYNIENDTIKEFVTKLSVGDEVILSGRIGEITRTSVNITGYNYYSEAGYAILCGNDGED